MHVLQKHRLHLTIQESQRIALTYFKSNLTRWLTRNPVFQAMRSDYFYRWQVTATIFPITLMCMNRVVIKLALSTLIDKKYP